VYSHLFVVVVFMVSVVMGYKYLGREALVAGRLRDGDRDLIPLFLFSELM